MLTEYINIGFNIESFIHITVILLGFLGLIFFLKLDRKRYGWLFILSALAGIILCYMFVKFNFYSFPYRLFPKFESIPVAALIFSFPIAVMLSVRYSPEMWGWKIPFYWVIIHIGMLAETWALTNTELIRYNYKWDFWDSYTWWWIYFLAFEWIGGLIVPKDLRSPIDINHLRFGKLGWAIVHFVLILTIFLGGYYLGSLK